MLDPKEIRTGNWVIKMATNYTSTKSFFQYKVVAPDEHFYAFAGMCFPIKLNSDVLGKAGFKYEFGDWYKNIPAEGIDDGLPFLRFKKQTKSWYLKDIRIPAQPDHLHQLQNLVYSLSGQELEVTLGLFKNPDIIGPVDFFTTPYHASELQKL